MSKSLISIADLNRKDILRLIELAKKVKKTPSKFFHSMQGKSFGLIFEKPSTRTWISFETGISSLGARPIYLGPSDMELGVREEIKDVARVLERYLSGVALRTFSHDTILEFKKYFKKPVINALSDLEHPCQALADYFTLAEKFSSPVKPVLAFVGDGNNVLNSLMLVAATIGAQLRFAVPCGYEPNQTIYEKACELARESKGEIIMTHDPREAVRDADAVYTDVWVSMGEESMRSEKIKAFNGMQINDDLLSFAREGACVMHCLPAHRGEEITDSVLEGENSIVFDQAENRMHMQKAILIHLYNKG